MKLLYCLAIKYMFFINNVYCSGLKSMINALYAKNSLFEFDFLSYFSLYFNG